MILINNIDNLALPDDIVQLSKLIVEIISPEKLILFGSYAYGQPNSKSDADFLALVSNEKITREDKVKMLTALYYAAKNSRIKTSYDLFIETELNAYAALSNDGAYVDALKRGVEVYVR